MTIWFKNESASKLPRRLLLMFALIHNFAINLITLPLALVVIKLLENWKLLHVAKHMKSAWEHYQFYFYLQFCSKLSFMHPVLKALQ